MRKKKGFECRDATDCQNQPLRVFLKTTTGQYNCTYTRQSTGKGFNTFCLFLHLVTSNHLRTTACLREHLTARHSFNGHRKICPKNTNIFWFCAGSKGCTLRPKTFCLTSELFTNSHTKFYQYYEDKGTWTPKVLHALYSQPPQLGAVE